MVKEYVKTTTAIYSLNSNDIKEAIASWLYDKHSIYTPCEAIELKTFKDGSMEVRHDLQKEYNKE